MGIPVEDAHGSLRLSLGHSTTEEDITFVLDRLPGIVQKLREMSPIYDPASCPPVVKVV
jgi:cysteine desulfurase